MLTKLRQDPDMSSWLYLMLRPAFPTVVAVVAVDAGAPLAALGLSVC